MTSAMPSTSRSCLSGLAIDVARAFRKAGQAAASRATRPTPSTILLLMKLRVSSARFRVRKGTMVMLKNSV